VSVAFRRDGDDEHKEPKFELPLPPGPNRVTARGLALIEARVAELEAIDTAALPEAEREQRLRELRYWRTRKATAEPMPLPPEDEVGFGSRVVVRQDGKTRTIDIVGDDEAEPHAGRLAFSAPLARALIGGFAGEEVRFGGKPLEILSTEAIPA
jgi:transcription elongation GreA/GreB family factor